MLNDLRDTLCGGVGWPVLREIILRTYRNVRRGLGQLTGAALKRPTVLHDGPGGVTSSVIPTTGQAMVKAMAKPDPLPSAIKASALTTMTGRAGSTILPHVIVIGDGDIPPVQLIAGVPLDHLSRERKVTHEIYYATQVLPLAETCLSADLLLVVRAYDRETLAFSRTLVRSGVPLIYAMDDDFDLLDPDLPLVEDLRRVGAWENMDALARMAVSVWVFSPPLADKFSRLAHDVRLTQAVAGPLDVKDIAGRSPRTDVIRFGYAGDLVHADNVAIIEPVIREVLDRHPSLVFESIGQEFAALRGHPRYHALPRVQGLETFFHHLQSRGWDFAVAPLRDTPLSAAKTDNKYRTYAALGLPAVYSRVPAFIRSVREGSTGLLASEDPAEWLRAIESLIQSGDLRREIGVNALQDAETRFAVPRIADLYLQRFAERMALPRLLVVGSADEGLMDVGAHRPVMAMSRRGVLNFAWCDVAEVDAALLNQVDAVAFIQDVDERSWNVLQAVRERNLQAILVRFREGPGDGTVMLAVDELLTCAHGRPDGTPHDLWDNAVILPMDDDEAAMRYWQVILRRIGFPILNLFAHDETWEGNGRGPPTSRSSPSPL